MYLKRVGGSLPPHLTPVTLVTGQVACKSSHQKSCVFQNLSHVAQIFCHIAQNKKSSCPKEKPVGLRNKSLKDQTGQLTVNHHLPTQHPSPPLPSPPPTPSPDNGNGNFIHAR